MSARAQRIDWSVNRLLDVALGRHRNDQIQRIALLRTIQEDILDMGAGCSAVPTLRRMFIEQVSGL